MIIKYIIISVVGVLMNACATHHEGNHYQRANQASQKALEQLDRN